MKTKLTKENAENWLVDILTNPLIQKKGKYGWYYVIATEGKQLHINQSGHNYALLNLYSLTKKKDNWKQIDLDCLPKRALALLAIIHREAYEYYKQIVQGEQK